MKLQSLIKFKFILIACLFLSLLGCGARSTVLYPPQDLITLQHAKVSKQKLSLLHHFDITGKVGFSDGKKGGNANIVWKQRDSAYEIRLYGPLGSGSLQIRGSPKEIFLVKEDGQLIYAKNPETLVEKELGLMIPVSGLRYWLCGNIASGPPPQQIQVDAENHIWKIEQQHWTITYQAYQMGQNRDLPSKLTLKNGPLRLKFILNNWEL